jgi:HD-GYP domain-containing protein (c-di-GMP phosphodiesterase class II)
MGLTEEQVKVVREGALLHDLGKVGVPDAVLLKNGPLEKHERGIIERHPTVGSSVLDGHEAFAEVRACVLHHHEHFDGSGYPEGLRGSAIPLAARIIAVADSYDAMTTDRPYRRALTHETAIERLRAGSGTQWDDVCVQALIGSLSKVPVVEVT